MPEEGLLDTLLAHQLHRANVDGAGFRVIGRGGFALDEQASNTVAGQEDGRAQAYRPSAGDQYRKAFHILVLWAML